MSPSSKAAWNELPTLIAGDAARVDIIHHRLDGRAVAPGAGMNAEARLGESTLHKRALPT